MSPRKKEILFRNNAFRLTATGLRQAGLTAELVAPDCLEITSESGCRRVHIPQPPRSCVGYRGDIPLLTAMYNLALHELHEDISAEGLMVAGASWSSVWTRDIAYAAALGADIAAPEATRRSLVSRVRDGIILQDTGTGGGWPVSTDRVAWVLGAWALYLSTGDSEWLHFCIDTLRNTLAQDAKVLPPAPLVSGETSFLDWRDQSYPDWMTPADIASSQAFSTNVLHYMTRRILARMLSEAGLKEEAEAATKDAADMALAIEEAFWCDSAGRYNILRTGDGCPEQRSDALATALAVLSGLAGNHAERAMNQLPRSAYGTPVFAPYKVSTPGSYHNRSIWPFVEAYVLLAHAELQDARGVEYSMACMLRAAMAFGTNKENFHASTGEAGGTIQNSDRQLWSVAGMLGLFYHGLLGIQYEHDNLVFNPCIPESFSGSHWFTGLRIRKMVLDVHLNGYGTEICSVMINGKAGSPIIPLDTEGHVQVELELLPPDGAPAPVSYPPAREDIPAPEWDAPDANSLSWKKVPGATRYEIYADGALLDSTAKLKYPLSPAKPYTYKSFHVRAINARCASALSAPYEYIAPGARTILHPVRIGECAEYTVENQQAWLDTRPCTSLLEYESVSLPEGCYLLRICYCNATASRRDGDTCALRELRIDGVSHGIIPFPHNTEQGQWEHYTLTAPRKLSLSQGEHTLALFLSQDCANTNIELNQCMVRYIELIRLS